LCSPETLDESEEEWILKQIASSPHDIGLRTRLVNFLIEEKRINDAFKYCFDLEMKFIENFQQSVDWYDCVATCLSKQTVKDWNYWWLRLISLDKRIYLRLKNKNLMHEEEILKVTSLISELYEAMLSASEISFKLTPAQAYELEKHFRGQLALHVASILLLLHSKTNNELSSEKIKKRLPFLLYSFQLATVDTDATWCQKSDENLKKLFQQLKKEGALRCAQSGRTALRDMGSTPYNFLAKAELFCSDPNWKKIVAVELFGNAEEQSTSYICQSVNFTKPAFAIPKTDKLEEFEEIARKQH
jgi:E3 SUMO-protein ligase RanBP2